MVWCHTNLLPMNSHWQQAYAQRKCLIVRIPVHIAHRRSRLCGNFGDDLVAHVRWGPFLTGTATLVPMHHIEGLDRDQAQLLPARVDDYVEADNPVRFIDAFVDGLDLQEAGFARVQPKPTRRPGSGLSRGPA